MADGEYNWKNTTLTDFLREEHPACLNQEISPLTMKARDKEEIKWQFIKGAPFINFFGLEVSISRLEWQKCLDRPAKEPPDLFRCYRENNH